jgi:hypothetical protein
MSDIPTDVRHSYIDVTENVSINEDVLVDKLKNVYCNDIHCSKLYVDEIHTNDSMDRSFEVPVQSVIQEVEPNSFVMGMNNHCVGVGSTIIGGEDNEVDGNYTSIVGGKENEVHGNFSMVLGGMDHQCISNHSMCMGVKGVAQHDFSLVFNTDNRNQASTTNTKQCIFNAMNGTYFRLPTSDTVRTDHVSEGMACLVWDPATESVCVKTKQNNILYRSSFQTKRHEIEVDLVTSEDSVSLKLNNPDVN